MSEQSAPSGAWPETVPATVMGTGARVEVPGKWMYDAPKWARAYRVQIDERGQPWLTSHADGASVFALPDSWQGRQVNSRGAIMNYGLDINHLRSQPSGSLQTNDPAFRMAEQCQPDQPCPTPLPGLGSDAASGSGLLVVGALIVVLILALLRFRKG